MAETLDKEKYENSRFCQCCGKELVELVVEQRVSSLPVNKYNMQTGELLKQYIKYCPKVKLVKLPIVEFMTTYIWETHTSLYYLI